MTNFESGVASYGFPLLGSGGNMSIRAAKDNEIFFVDDQNGNDSNSGKTVKAAVKTIQKAVDKASNDKGAYIFIGEGAYTEQVSITKRGLHLIGMGPGLTQLRPTSGMSTKGTAQITPLMAVSPVHLSGKPLGVEIANMSFWGSGGYSGLYIGDGLNGTANASYTTVNNCIFEGSNREGVVGCLIEGGSYIRIINSIFASWSHVALAIASGFTRSAYYNIAQNLNIFGGGTRAIGLFDIANSNQLHNIVISDDATTAFTATITVTSLAGVTGCNAFLASSGTDNSISAIYTLSTGTEPTLGNGDHMCGNYARTAGDGSLFVSEA